MFKKIAFRLMIFSVLMALMGVLFQWLIPQYASFAIPIIIIFFFLITLFTLFIVFKTNSQTSNKKFIFSYMLSRTIKLTAMLLFLVLYIIFNKEDRWYFAGAFLIIYSAYSIFEIVALKKNNEKPL
jgi:L-asparagine transporter-like permease